MRLALIDNDSANLDKVVADLSLPESDVVAIKADVSDSKALTDAAIIVQDKLGANINVLLLNAGTSVNEVNQNWNGNVDAWIKVGVQTVVNITYCLTIAT